MGRSNPATSTRWTPASSVIRSILALIAAVLVSLGIGAVSQSPRLSNDTTIGVFFVGAFAFGIALISAQKTYTRDLNTFLLGSILGVSRNDLYLTAIVGAIVLSIILLLRRELTIVAFDRTFAKATGLNLWLYDQIFLILLSLAIVISLFNMWLGRDPK